MTVSSDCLSAPLYSGGNFPTDSLSASDFEDFVFASLQCVAEVLGLRLTGQPAGTGDGGFDVEAQVLRSNRFVCIQCKRQKDPLGTEQVAEELAKVAATSVLEGSDVGEHRFICTGGVRKKLRNQLRETSRNALATAAARRLATAVEGELAQLRTELEARGHDARGITEHYVRSLDALMAWDFHEFNVALSSRWDSVLRVAERFFTVATVVREFPRASFSRTAYITEHSSGRLSVEPRLSIAELPAGISASSAASPGTSATSTRRAITSLSQLLDMEPGSLVLLVGDGGAGKSAALKWVRAQLLQSKSESTLPVMISLAKYGPSGLDHAIHRELDVIHGTWRSLPDQVVLLCDGLNECPPDHVDAFLDELQPLLKRKQIACLLSTRDSLRRTKIVLPHSPAACVRIDSITPIGIRRITDEELRDGTAPAFVANYRALADASGSPLLWTPFAVLAAIKLWRVKAALPSTLGEMLEGILRWRCDRNLERSDRRLPPEVILQLAGALAFESLIVDQRLECPQTEAGSWIRRAQARCADSLGVSDLSETDVAELLIHHELLHRSVSGHYGFEHQMTAGALAAPHLARFWRDHIGCLADTISDDAWVFAARLVGHGDANEFLDATIGSDLLLGARTARELPPDSQRHAKELLDSCVAQDSPEIVRIRGAYALAVLRSPEALAKLRKMKANRASPVLHQVCAALAAAGDGSYLQQLLVTVDAMRSGGIRVSGGEISIWETAPLPVRLDIARRRLFACPPGEPVAESLFLVAFERDPEDAPVIERHLRAAKTLTAWFNALRALRSVMPTRAQAVADTTVLETTDVRQRASILLAASAAGIEVDVRIAFDCAISGDPAQPAESPIIELHKLISDVIDLSTLSADLIAAIEHDLPRSSGDRRERLWRLAYGCHSSAIAEYATACIEAWGEQTGNACTFFTQQSELAKARKNHLLSCCEAGLRKEEEGALHEWKVERALSLIQRLGSSESAGRSLATILKRLANILAAVDTGTVASLSVADRTVLERCQPQHARIHLTMLVANLVPSIARARDHLSPATLLSLLQFDLHSNSITKELQEALSDLSDASIDQTLERIQDPWVTLSGLEVVCPRGATETRTKILETQLRLGYNHPAKLHLLCRAIAACWCKPILEMVLRTVSGIQTWSEYDSQFFWELARMVAAKVDKSDTPLIEKALAQAKTNFAKKLLDLWLIEASGKRLGLSMLRSKAASQG